MGADTSQDGQLAAARELRHSIRRAMAGVEAALAAPAPGRVEEWSADVAGRLEDLREAFRSHVALTESPTGFLAQIVDRAPRLVHAVDRLRAEHATIAGALDDAAGTVRSAEGADGVDAARTAVVGLLQQLAHHRQRGADAVYEAYDVDIEAGD